MKSKKAICVFLAAMLCFSLSALSTGCKIRKPKATVIVTDMLGEQVEVTLNPKKVACVSRTTYDLLIAFGVGDCIDGVYETLLNNEWAEVFDNDASTRYACKYEESYETFITRGVDIVFAPEKYITDGLKEHGITALNISLYGNPSFDGYVFFFADLVKQIWSDNTVAEKVDEWKTYMSEAIDSVHSELIKHQTSKRTVYYVRGDKNKGIGYTDSGHSFVEYAYGSVLGMAYLGSALKTTKPSAEAICLADPDVFVIGGTYQKTLAEELKKEPYINLDAVKNGQIYNIPIGLTMFEQLSVFSPVFLHDQANKLYPEYFDFDTAGEIKTLSKRFFDVDLTDAEVSNMLDGLSKEGLPLV